MPRAFGVVIASDGRTGVGECAGGGGGLLGLGFRT